MASPVGTFQRPDLGMAFEAFDLAADQLGFVGLKVMPMFPTAQLAANFTFFTTAQMLKTAKTERAPGAGFERGDQKFGQSAFNCVKHGYEELVDDDERAIYAYAFDADEMASAQAAAMVLRNLEIHIANAVQSTSNAGGNAAVSVKWSTSATCTPINDVMTAHKTFRSQCGMSANALVMSKNTLLSLKVAKQITDRLNVAAATQDPKTVTPAQLAALFEVEMVIVGDNMQNTANEGQVAALSSIWSDTSVSLCKVAKTNNIKEPCMGRTFHFTGMSGSEPGSIAVSQYREENKKSDVFRAETNYHGLVIAPACNYILTNIS